MFVIKRTVADSYLTMNYTVTPTPNGPSGFAIGGYGGNTSATFLPGVSELSVNLTLNGSGPLPGSAKMTLNPSSQYTIMGADSNTVAIFDVGGDSKWINVFRRVDPVGNTLNEGGDKGRFVVSRYFRYPTGQPLPIPDFVLVMFGDKRDNDHDQHDPDGVCFGRFSGDEQATSRVQVCSQHGAAGGNLSK